MENRGCQVVAGVLVLLAIHSTAGRVEAQQHGAQSIFRSTFLANEGQWPKEILYKGRSASANASFLRDGVSFSLVKPEDEHGHEAGHEEKDHHAEPDFEVWNMRFVDAAFGMQVTGEGGTPSVTSYLGGTDPSRRVVHPKEYRRVDYIDVYPGIDAQFTMVGLDLKYDHIVHPGGDPSKIRIRYEGVQALSIDADGGLVVRTRYGRQKQMAPVSWQLIDGTRRKVDVDFLLVDANTFGFHVRGDYDGTKDLVIDPLFEMVWASYTACLGGSNNINYCFANAMDPQGNVYLTGMVDGTFPTTPGAYSGPGNIQPEIFVAKFSADGTTLLYSTYLPGSSSEFGTSIAVDTLGRAYITGVVDLNITGQTTYPSTVNAYQPVHAPGSDAILTVLNPDGTNLVYSTFLGGSSSETGYSVALGATGIAYVAGTTTYLGFPEVNAVNYVQGDKDLFVAKFDIDQSGAASLLYSVRIGAGPCTQCTAHGVAVDQAGNAYVTGSVGVSFGTSQFPVTPGAYSTTYDGGNDGGCAYLVKLGDPFPVAVEYATYLGPGMGAAVDVDEGGAAFVAGTTATPGFPTTAGVLQPLFGGGNSDAFALKINDAGAALIYATFLGGPGQDQGTDIVVNGIGEAYVAGISRGDFPTSPGALQEAHAGVFSNDLFVLQLNADATGYGCGGSTYFGGSEDEYYGSFYDYFAPSITLRDNNGSNDTLCIAATTHSQDLPTTPGVYEPNKVNSIADQPFFLKLTCATLAMAPVADFNATNDPECGTYLADFADASEFGATTWAWAFAGGTPPTSAVQDPQDIAFPGPGTYAVTLIACNAVGCDTITQLITVDPIEPISVDLGSDTSFCAGGAVLLDAGVGATYTWSRNATVLTGNGATLLVSQSGTYSVLVADDLGCFGTDSVTVVVLEVPAPVVSFTVERVPCGGASVRLSVIGDADLFQWDLGDGGIALGNPVTYAYDSAGTYTVSVLASNGPCDSVVTLVVDVPAASTSAYTLGPVPNIFTPNGDGENDLFLPLGPHGIPGCASLVILNRWGQELRTIADAADGWNGRSSDGQPVPGGVYFYHLHFGDQDLTGHVELLR